MSTEKSESLNFYTYLSQKIGSEHVVRIRRLNATISDLGHYEYGIVRSITSGSRGEGLQLKQSDSDMMNINTIFKVYESETEVVHQSEVKVPLIINTEDTGPCFAQLCLLNHPDYHYISTGGLMNMWQNNHLGCVLSSEQYRSMFFSINAYDPFKFLFKIHGPCLSDKYDELDILDSNKCDQWIFQAQPWVSKPRTMWPPPELVSKIISCGVLFVPIGCKGSANENLE
ncbi:unnamed protein product [Mytilus coruscus]|uniref:Uncharacterized protein n=1 Tax=Mytilus coruscus TaxID=42192 RepID=A0A6J8BCU9_MYTCO|nr:unnamed protein product [Mytilus coruscus]